MSALEIGQALVAAANSGREAEESFVAKYYADNIVSIEGADSDDMPARMEGIEAIHGKHEWWWANNDVPGTTAEGPFIGNRQDQFVIRYTLDMTPNGGERTQMAEVGLYTVDGGKIVQEEYLYLMG